MPLYSVSSVRTRVLDAEDEGVDAPVKYRCLYSLDKAEFLRTLEFSRIGRIRFFLRYSVLLQ